MEIQPNPEESKVDEGKNKIASVGGSSGHQMTRPSSSSFRLGSSLGVSTVPTKFFGQRSLRSSEARMRYASRDENNNNGLYQNANHTNNNGNNNNSNNNHGNNNHYVNSIGHYGLGRKAAAAFVSSFGHVKKWEKRLVAIDNSTLVLYRWVPVVIQKNLNS